MLESSIARKTGVFNLDTYTLLRDAYCFLPEDVDSSVRCHNGKEALDSDSTVSIEIDCVFR